MSLTGFEIIDAILTNPLEAIGLFGVSLLIYKLFFTHNGIFNDPIRHLKWSLKYDLDNQLENLVEWLDRRDKAYNEWAKKQTRKKFLKLELIILSSVFIPLLTWNAVFMKKDIINLIFFYVMVTEYIGVMLLSFYRYKHPKIKENKIEKTS